ncbi:hypothetical protein SUSAZ_05525 [Sulfolobus acidocaldarius SUSAZ]|nr:hypothetical protein SUSAZ_05525 [Sulfolobus acidocaldarius SUSAZ]
MFEVNDEFIDALTVLGISKKEALVFAYLTYKGGATAKEMISDLYIHQPQLYNILLSLERKGLIYVQNSKPKFYIPARLNIVLEKIDQEQTKRKHVILEQMKKLETNHRKSQGMMWMTKSTENVLNNCISVITGTKNELYVEIPNNYLQKLISYIIKVAESGVKTYLNIYPNVDEFLVNKLLESKVMEVKVHSLGHFFLVSADAEESVFMPRVMSLSTNPNIYSYVFRDSTMSLFFIHYYFEGWRTSRTVYRKAVTQSDFPMIFSAHRFATWEIMKAKEQGLRLKVKVDGVITRTGENVELFGYPNNVNISSEVINFELVEERSGRSYLIGGDNALVEDVSAEKIEVYIQ